jgi:Ran GTPase-activating protein (RanGAP) involved in mRNA processing and transport
MWISIETTTIGTTDGYSGKALGHGTKEEMTSLFQDTFGSGSSSDFRISISRKGHVLVQPGIVDSFHKGRPDKENLILKCSRASFGDEEILVWTRQRRSSSSSSTKRSALQKKFIKALLQRLQLKRRLETLLDIVWSRCCNVKQLGIRGLEHDLAMDVLFQKLQTSQILKYIEVQKLQGKEQVRSRGRALQLCCKIVQGENSIPTLKKLFVEDLVEGYTPTLIRKFFQAFESKNERKNSPHPLAILDLRANRWIHTTWGKANERYHHEETTEQRRLNLGSLLVALCVKPTAGATLSSSLSSSSSSSSLKSLDLSGNLLSQSSAFALAKALPHLQLDSLLLRNTGLEAATLLQIMHSLKKSTTVLRELDLSRNTCTLQVMKALCSALQKNKNLTSLSMDHCNIDLEQVQHLANTLPKIKYLESLSLDGNEFTSGGPVLMGDGGRPTGMWTSNGQRIVGVSIEATCMVNALANNHSLVYLSMGEYPKMFIPTSGGYWTPPKYFLAVEDNTEREMIRFLFRNLLSRGGFDSCNKLTNNLGGTIFASGVTFWTRNSTPQELIWAKAFCQRTVREQSSDTFIVTDTAKGGMRISIDATFGRYDSAKTWGCGTKEEMTKVFNDRWFQLVYGKSCPIRLSISGKGDVHVIPRLVDSAHSRSRVPDNLILKCSGSSCEEIMIWTRPQQRRRSSSSSSTTITTETSAALQKKSVQALAQQLQLERQIDALLDIVLSSFDVNQTLGIQCLEHDLAIDVLFRKLQTSQIRKLEVQGLSETKRVQSQGRALQLCSRIIQGNSIPTLKELFVEDLAKQYPPMLIRKFFQALESNESLEILDFRASRRIHTWGKASGRCHEKTELGLNLGSLLLALCTKPTGATPSSLKKLDLSGNLLSQSSAFALAKALPHLQLDSLLLRHTGLEVATLLQIMHSLKNSTTVLRELDLSRNTCTLQVMKVLCSALQKNKNLTSLSMDHCNIDLEQVQHLASTLPKIKYLEILSLDGNEFTNRPVLGGCLLGMRTRNRRDIGSISIGATCMVNALVNNHSLMSLSMGANPRGYSCCTTPMYPLAVEYHKKQSLLGFLHRNRVSRGGFTICNETTND